jgi:hypothetical protein
MILCVFLSLLAYAAILVRSRRRTGPAGKLRSWDAPWTGGCSPSQEEPWSHWHSQTRLERGLFYSVVFSTAVFVLFYSAFLALAI